MILAYLDDRAFLEAVDVLELREVVQRLAVQLQGEARPVARVLPVHQQLVDLLHQLGAAHLRGRGENAFTDGSTEDVR